MGDDEHLSNEKEPAPRAAPDFTPPLPPHPSMSVLPMICLFSKLLAVPAILYTSVIHLLNEKEQETRVHILYLLSPIPCSLL